MGLKDTSKIPFGCYCYTSKGIIKNKLTGYPEMQVDPCFYYEHKKGLYGYCHYIKKEITDQVKDCGENWEDV